MKIQQNVHVATITKTQLNLSFRNIKASTNKLHKNSSHPNCLVPLTDALVGWPAFRCSYLHSIQFPSFPTFNFWIVYFKIFIHPSIYVWLADITYTRGNSLTNNQNSHSECIYIQCIKCFIPMNNKMVNRIACWMADSQINETFTICFSLLCLF